MHRCGKRPKKGCLTIRSAPQTIGISEGVVGKRSLCYSNSNGGHTIEWNTIQYNTIQYNTIQSNRIESNQGKQQGLRLRSPSWSIESRYSYYQLACARCSRWSRGEKKKGRGWGCVRDRPTAPHLIASQPVTEREATIPTTANPIPTATAMNNSTA